MPQNPTMVMEKDGEKPTYMWSVDAREAMALGDYLPLPPDKEVSSEERASAMSRFKTGQGQTHPELQTEEEREKTREEANERAALTAGVPEGAQVVVMAPSPEEKQRRTDEHRGRQAQAREAQAREAREAQARTSAPASPGSSPSTSSTTAPRKD